MNSLPRCPLPWSPLHSVAESISGQSTAAGASAAVEADSKCFLELFLFSSSKKEKEFQIIFFNCPPKKPDRTRTTRNNFLLFSAPKERKKEQEAKTAEVLHSSSFGPHMNIFCCHFSSFLFQPRNETKGNIWSELTE